MTYSPNIAALFQRGAIYVDKILKGAKPEDLPVEQPTKFKFIINMTTAKALGGGDSAWLLVRADRIIQ
jgi:putative ABC transport system substrate-binding protein